jgi:hypothetical protein
LARAFRSSAASRARFCGDATGTAGADREPGSAGAPAWLDFRVRLACIRL